MTLAAEIKAALADPESLTDQKRPLAVMKAAVELGLKTQQKLADDDENDTPNYTGVISHAKDWAKAQTEYHRVELDKRNAIGQAELARRVDTIIGEMLAIVREVASVDVAERIVSAVGSRVVEDPHRLLNGSG